MAEHKLSQCDHCGQIDDHPKSHWNTGETFHFDCLPFDKEAEFIASHPDAAAHVEAAKSGKRGNELRQHVRTLAEERAAKAVKESE